jgi:hypothetical protein
MNDDKVLVTRISDLVAEARRVRAGASRGEGLTSEENLLLAELEAQTESCWDQLRRRRSRRYFGDGSNPIASDGRAVGPRRTSSKRGLTAR